MQDEIDKIKDKEIVLVLSGNQEFEGREALLLKSLMGSKSYGVVLTVTQPYDKIAGMVGKEIAQRMFFIDCISRKGALADRGENYVCIDNPANLTEIGIAITESLRALPEGKRLFFIDSVTSLAVCVPKNTFAKFSHFIASKTREHGALGVFMGIENGMDKETENTLLQFCDRVLSEGDG